MRLRRPVAAIALPLACLAPLAPVRAQDVERAALATAMATGRWSPAIERAYGDYALARARQTCGERVAPEFWDWLGARPAVRDVVVWATVAEPVPKVFVCLDRLRRAHGDAVATLPDLAVGFGFAWSAGDGDEPRRTWESWSRGRSAIPRFSAWTGGRDQGWGTLLGGSGARVVGVPGRSGALIDAFGLIVDAREPGERWVRTSAFGERQPGNRACRMLQPQTS